MAQKNQRAAQAALRDSHFVLLRALQLQITDRIKLGWHGVQQNKKGKEKNYIDHNLSDPVLDVSWHLERFFSEERDQISRVSAEMFTNLDEVLNCGVLEIGNCSFTL